MSKNRPKKINVPVGKRAAEGSILAYWNKLFPNAPKDKRDAVKADVMDFLDIMDQCGIAFCVKATVDDTPLLGLASTRQLLEELEARFRISHKNREVADDLAAIQDATPEDHLNYRTVDTK